MKENELARRARRARPRGSRHRSSPARRRSRRASPSADWRGWTTRAILLALRSTDRDVRVEPPLHVVFEREGLDHAHALQRFLHGLDDARAAVNCMRAMLRTRATSLRRTSIAGGAATKPAIDITGSCITITMTKPDQRHQIAADGGDQKIDDRRHGLGAGGQPRDEFGRMPIGEEADVLAASACRTSAADCRRRCGCRSATA